MCFSRTRSWYTTTNSGFPPSSPDYNKTLEHQDHTRNQRLKELHDEVYEKIPFRPEISEYAKQHSGGHSHRLQQPGSELVMDDSTGEVKVVEKSVYDRLYAAYTVAQTAKSGVLERKMGRGGPEVPYRPPKPTATSELLYSDALDRRQRQQERSSHTVVVKPVKPAILPKSRRYVFCVEEVGSLSSLHVLSWWSRERYQ